MAVRGRTTPVPVTGDMVSVMGKRWNKPDYLTELLEAEDAPELIKFWRSPDRRGPGRTRSAPRPGRSGFSGGI